MVISISLISALYYSHPFACFGFILRFFFQFFEVGAQIIDLRLFFFSKVSIQCRKFSLSAVCQLCPINFDILYFHFNSIHLFLKFLLSVFFGPWVVEKSVFLISKCLEIFPVIFPLLISSLISLWSLYFAFVEGCLMAQNMFYLGICSVGA